MKLGRHSKPSNKKGVLTRPKSRSQANIAGYEKRLARKAKTNLSTTTTTDLYDHVPEKSRRSKVTLDLGCDDEEYYEFRDGGKEDDDDGERERLRARLIGEIEDDEKVDSDDDEEVDSDAAFEESDEERFEGFFSHKKKAQDSEEEEEEEEEGDDSDFVDLLDVLDGKGEIDNTSDSEDQLKDFVSNLDVISTKRKATEDPSEVGANTDTRAPKRRLVKEITEAGVENEFRARSSGSKLNIDDLLAPLASQSSALQSLEKSAKVLTSSSSKAKTLSAPLPQRTQERLDRQTAYEQTKEEVDKWSETMKHIRMAEHLSFPLQSQSTGRVSNLELTAKFKPTTALESSVDALLKSSGLRDEDIHRTEEAMLQMNQVSVEEVAQRRGELRKMRELMFRAEFKARHAGKIKSKTYRRIKRKEKEVLGQKSNDDDDDDSSVEVGTQEANGIKAFEQRDLVAVAFAGDNVVQNFEEAKSREIASDAPREVDTTIPGWGSWGGAGIQKLPPKPQRIKKIAGIDPTMRADFNKKHIIISEKRDKKAGKYLVKDLPYPYTSRAQFERAMENPLGAEWNTRVAFQRGTLPKVVKKPGVIINPLEKMTS